MILLYISDLLAGFLVLYIHCSLKRKNISENSDIHETGTNIELISRGEKSISKSKTFMQKIIIICLFDFINRLAFYAFFQINQGAKHDNISDKAQKDIIIHLDIIVRYLFSIFLLKIKVHKHHKFAFSLVLINFPTPIATDVTSLHYVNQGINERLTYIYIGFFSVRGILFPLEDVIIKKVFSDDYILPEEIMLFRDFGEFVLIIIITPILYFSLYRNFTFLFGDMTKIILTIILYTFYY